MNYNYQYSSPFNFLNSYQKKDKNIFFGRSKEINDVFNLFKKTNLVVLYGTSGSGKSSLSQCGVANRYNDWKSIIIRRNESLIDSFFIEIEALLGEQKCNALKKSFETIADNSIQSEINDSGEEELKLNLVKEEQLLFELEEVLDSFFENITYSPCFIFDQFEELFISGSELEILKFSLLLFLITSRVKTFNIVICVQTEFYTTLMKLKSFSKNIDYKHEITDPGIESVREILKGTFEYYNINQKVIESESDDIANLSSLSEDDKDDRIQQIIDCLQKDKKVHLPFLQIYLDKLYVEDFIRTYPSKKELLLSPKKIEFDKTPLQFTEDEIKIYGDIEKILTEYIKEVNDAVIYKKNKIDNSNHRDTVLKFLKEFVSEKDTSKTFEFILKRTDDGQKIKYLAFKNNNDKENIINAIWDKNEDDTEKSIGDIIEELLKARILKRHNNFLELSHNYLVQIIKKIPVDRDILEYYRNHFNSSFNTYQKQRKNGIKRPNLLSPSLVVNIEKDRDRIVNEGDSEKRDFWRKSLFAAKRKRIISRVTILILVLSVLIAAIVAKENRDKTQELSKKELELTKANKELISKNKTLKFEKEKNKSTINVLEKLTTAISEEDTDLTKMYNSLKNINNEFESQDYLEKKDLKIFEETYNRVLNNFSIKPFYLKKISLSSNSNIKPFISTKTRLDKFGNLIVFAETKDNLFSSSIEFNKIREDVKWKSLNKSLITTYEPYILNGKVRVLYSNNYGLYDTDHTFTKSYRKERNLNKLYLIEHIHERVFIAISKNKDSLYKIDLDTNDYSSISLLKKDFLKLVNKQTENKVAFLKKSSNNEFCYLAELEDGNPYLIKYNIDLKEVTDYLDLSVLINSSEKVKAFEINEKEIILGIDKLIYAIDLSNFSLNKNKLLPKIITNHSSNISSIHSKDSLIFIGSDDNTASLYVKKNEGEILSKQLIGHSSSVNNVSLVRNNKKLYAITSEEDGYINIWDLSPIARSSMKVSDDATRPIKIKFNKNNNDNRLYIGSAFNKDFKNGYLFSANGNFKDTLRHYTKFYPRKSFLTAFDFTNNNEIYVGTYWNGYINNIKGGRKSMRPKSNNNIIRINDLKIGLNGLAIATNKGLFFHSEFERDTVGIPPAFTKTIGVNFNSVDIHPNQDLILGTSSNGNIYLLNPFNPKNIEIYSDHFKSVRDASFSKDGKYFVSGSSDNTAIVWKLSNKNSNKAILNKEGVNAFNPIDTIQNHTGDIKDIALGEIDDYIIIATASSDKTVLLHRIDKRRSEFVLERIPSIIRHDYGIESISFGESDYIIYSADEKGYIKKWDWKNFKNDIDKRAVDIQN